MSEEHRVHYKVMYADKVVISDSTCESTSMIYLAMSITLLYRRVLFLMVVVCIVTSVTVCKIGT